jgi:hypothetical protein
VSHIRNSPAIGRSGTPLVIDIAGVLDALDAAWMDRQGDPVRRECPARRVVSEVLTRMGIRPGSSIGDPEMDVRDLYFSGSLPTEITLGALAVLFGAQSAQTRGLTWAGVVDEAGRAAASFLDLVPLSVLVRAKRQGPFSQDEVTARVTAHPARSEPERFIWAERGCACRADGI